MHGDGACCEPRCPAPRVHSGGTAAPGKSSPTNFRPPRPFDRGPRPAHPLIRSARPLACAVRVAGISQRTGADLAVRRLRRIVGMAPRCQRRTLHRGQRSRAAGSPAASSIPAATWSGSPTSRPHRCSGPTASRSPRDAGMIRNRSRSTAPYVYVGLERVNQVLRYDFSKGFTRAAGVVVPLPPAAKQAAAEQGAGSAGDGAERLCAGRHADCDLRARAGCGWQHHRLPGRRPDAGPVQRSPQREFRHQRRRTAGVGRSSDPGAKIFLAWRARHPHPPHRARFGDAGRRARWARDLLCRSRQRGRQYGRHRRPRHARKAIPC